MPGVRRAVMTDTPTATATMTTTELTARIETLETRLMHQEATLEELTNTLLKQERLLAEQAETIRRIETMVRTRLPDNLARPEEETPPPHY
jgi:SlyX protein